MTRGAALAALGSIWGLGCTTVGSVDPAPASVPPSALISASQVVALEAPEPTARIPYGPSPLQFGQLRLPDGPGPHPVVLFIHGGCWLAEYDIGHVGPLEQGLADAGYAVWSLEYRRVGDEGGGWPNTFLDIADGTDHLRELAGSYPLDLQRVVASGHSAGGQFALWLAARDRLPRESPLHRPRPLRITGVLALAPAADLEGLSEGTVCGDVVSSLMGGSPKSVPERYRDGSPMQLLAPDVPQVVVLGAFDEAWGPSGRAYVEHARESGLPLRVVEAGESGHFEMIVPSTSTWPLVLKALAQLTQSPRAAR